MPLSVLAFGTSLTARYDWPEALRIRLATCLDRPVEMAVVAAPGMGSAWAAGDGLARVARQPPPDLIIAEFAINDADILDGAWLRDSRRQHEAVIAGLRNHLAPGGAILLMTTNPVEGWLRHLQRPRLAAYYRLYEDLAAAHGLGLADMTPRWQAAMAQAPLLPDGLHPDQAAARALIVPVLADLIARAAGAQGCNSRTG